MGREGEDPWDKETGRGGGLCPRVGWGGEEGRRRGRVPKEGGRDRAGRGGMELEGRW